MKKNKWWMLPVILLAVFGLVMLGCPTDSKSSGNETPETPDADLDDLWDSGWVPGVSKSFTGVTFVLDDNFQYDNGYQAVKDWTDLFNADIALNDVYEIEMEFTASRDLETDLKYGFVDHSEAAGWWTALTPYKIVGLAPEDEPEEDPDAEEDFTTVPDPLAALIKKDAKITFTGRTIASEAAAKKADIQMFFTTKGEGTKGSAGTGKQGKVTLTFTKLVITKMEWSDDPDSYTPPVAVDPIFAEPVSLAFAKGSQADESTGKGNIEGDDFAKIKAAKGESYIIISLEGPIGGEGNPQGGWGVGTVGNLDNIPDPNDSSKTINPNVGINVPNGTATGTATEYSVKLMVEDILKCLKTSSDSYIFLNIWSDQKITKVELFVQTNAE